MTESFPRQEARTRRFTLGVPRAFRISPDGTRVAFLRTQGGGDPVTCLWVLDVGRGPERLVADPRRLGGDEEDLSPQERARRERVREQAGGIVAYATDADLVTAIFPWSGRVYAVDLTHPDAAPHEVPVAAPAMDPRPDPTGKRLAYVCAGALRVASLADPTEDQVLADPQGAPHVTFGLAEFIAAEEMDRHRGYWWSPDGSALLVARVDETLVPRWHIADPANPERPPAEVAYPAAGTPNAEVSLLLARLDGTTVDVEIDHAAFPYLVTACWEGEHDPLVVVQSRDQRTMRLLAVDAGTGQTEVLREDTDPRWLEIVPGVPAWAADGRLVWTADIDDTRRLLVSPPGPETVPVTPRGLQVRGVLGVDGDTVLFQASAEPTQIELWTYGPGGLSRIGEGGGVEAGTRAGGITVISRRGLDDDGVTVQVYRDSTLASTLASRAERPALPAPRPVLFGAGSREIRTAVLFPSWHQPGQRKLPVLLDPYGGPHAQRVLKARSAYLTSQWFAEQGFAVVIADGRGTPGRGPEWERAVAGDLAGPVLQDQIDALHDAAARFADLDTGRVAIRGWSFGGYLAALAALRRPEEFHAAIAGAPVTDWHLYDTHYTERYLGFPDRDRENYERSSLIPWAERAAVAAPAQAISREEADAIPPRPLMLIHGLADDNVVVAHTLRLSGALLAAGYPHAVLPLSGITHMASQETVAENLLLLQLDFLRGALGPS
jgi:dipeptidyl-peptidase-4